jgi:hypothetical protein
VVAVVAVLDALDDRIAAHPAPPARTRFGNPAFRTWHADVTFVRGPGRYYAVTCLLSH